MTDSYYECHITFSPQDFGSSGTAESIVRTKGWRFSAIDGDIIQGNGVKWYATRHYNTALPYEAVLARLFEMAYHLTACKYHVSRRKIEHVIFDDRSSKICPPSCLACIKQGE